MTRRRIDRPREPEGSRSSSHAALFFAANLLGALAAWVWIWP